MITATAVSFVVLFFISSKGEMGMKTIQTELVEKGLKQATRGKLVCPNTKRNKKRKERYSRREIEELMGCNRDTYKRVRGAVKRR